MANSTSYSEKKPLRGLAVKTRKVFRRPLLYQAVKDVCSVVGSRVSHQSEMNTGLRCGAVVEYWRTATKFLQSCQPFCATKSDCPSPMSKKPKRKLTAAEKRARRERKEKFMTIFINGKQKRVPRPQLIEGLSVDEFIAQNADPIWLHQNEMWEFIVPDDDGEVRF